MDIVIVLYGLILAATGLNGLYFKKGKPVLSAEASAAHQGLERALFIFPVAYLSLIVGGGLLIFRQAEPLALILVSPTLVAILLFNFVLQKNYFGPGLFFCIANAGVALYFSPRLIPLFL